jgi:Tol biopolymer transport system component/DNA-binding winged helix-turn-helix (wHTH) protein
MAGDETMMNLPEGEITAKPRLVAIYSSKPCMEPARIYRFDGITLDVAAKRLRRGDQDLVLEPKSFRVLEFLIEGRDRVLSKGEIFQVVWEETNVTDNALTRSIAQIRKVLEDDPKNPRFIETVPTIGYRFIGNVTEELAQSPMPERRVPWIRVWIAVGILAGGLAGFWAWHLLSRRTEPPVAAPEPFTTYRGNETAPSFSPDGTQIAFQWDGEKQDNLDIYVKGLGSDAVPLRLTTNSLPDGLPSWSPDGRTIAFLRFTSSNRCDLILIPALGGPEKKLTEVSSSQYPGFAPTWSGDSKWLIVPALVKEHAALFRVSVETGELSQITNPEGSLGDLFPTISPDGKTLLFNRQPAFFYWGTLFAVHIDESAKPVEAPRSIPSRELLFADARWTADGKEILARTSNGVFLMPAQGNGDLQQIPWLGWNTRGMDLSRQGHRLVYAVVRGDANIWRIDLTAKAPVPQQLIASTFRDVYPKYSPDGSEIAFQSDRGQGRNQIWVGDTAGRQARQLTFTKRGLAGTPHWSPDGRILAFDSNETGTYQVYMISSDGGKVSQLTDGKFDNFGATWSRNGQWLYFTSTRTGRGEVWKMPASGGVPIQVTHTGAWFGVESEDGKTLYFGRSAGSGSILKMPVDGGPEEQLATSVYRANYAVSKLGVYYMTRPSEDGNCSLKLYSFATGITSTILQIGRPEWGLDVSPDGHYLVYAELDDPASDLMLVENFR